MSLLTSSHGLHRHLHSFPTRRSSDLDMDLAAKGLGAKEWNNSLKTKLSLLPKKLFRIRMSRNFWMKMLTMTNLSTECLKIGRRFSRNAETDLVCRLLLEKKKKW